MLRRKTFYLFILLPLVLLALIFVVSIKEKVYNYVNGKLKINGAVISGAEASYIGEKISYDVKLGKLSLGRAEFNNVANVELDGRILNLMTIETKLTKFTDREKIYSDLKSLLPARVERDILNWLIREKITEVYDQEKFTVTITKTKGAKKEELVIKKDTYIHNAALLPYYLRRIAKLDVGRMIIANLPTRRLEIKLVSIEDIKVPAGTFKAYHFKSYPKQIEIWVSTDERRIPLKIQGTGLFRYSMAMKEYTGPSAPKNNQE